MIKIIVIIIISFYMNTYVFQLVVQHKNINFVQYWFGIINYYVMLSETK